MRFFVLFLRHFYLFVVLFERGGERDGETEGEREGVREETNIKGRRNGEKEREREREMGPRLPIPCFSLPLSPYPPYSYILLLSIEKVPLPLRVELVLNGIVLVSFFFIIIISRG